MEILYTSNYINMYEEKWLLSNYIGALAWELEPFRKAAVFKAFFLSFSLLLVNMCIEDICLSPCSSLVCFISFAELKPNYLRI